MGCQFRRVLYTLQESEEIFQLTHLKRVDHYQSLTFDILFWFVKCLSITFLYFPIILADHIHCEYVTYLKVVTFRYHLDQVFYAGEHLLTKSLLYFAPPHPPL